jgi:hypothetical protein
MNTLTFLEKLAQNTHHRPLVKTLLGEQPDKIKNAILTNNASYLKEQFGSSTLATDMCHVLQN